MEPPPGINSGGRVCKLKNALYSLKQSPQPWFGRFSSFMKKIGYNQSDVDHTIFTKMKNKKVTAVFMYVDDMVVIVSYLEDIVSL